MFGPLRGVDGAKPTEQLNKKPSFIKEKNGRTKYEGGGYVPRP